MSGLMSKIMKSSKNPYLDKLVDSELMRERYDTPTDIPALNIALSGEIDHGFRSGLTILAGPSRHFKSLFAVEMAKAYLKQHEDAVVVFIDSEFGSPMEYFEGLGEDINKVIHMPVVSLEEFRNETVKILENLERGEKVFFLLDSYGSLASEKEIDDAKAGHNASDMGLRAKVGKSVFRIITNMMVMRDLPMVAINHTYDTMEMYSKKVMSGGQGPMLASDNVIFIGKQQEKEGKELVGSNFVLMIEKSRYAQEKKKTFVTVRFDTGIDRYSSIFDLAVASGIIGNPSKGYYVYGNDKKVRRSEIETPQNMEEILSNETFKEFVKDKYKLKPMQDNSPVELINEEGTGADG